MPNVLSGPASPRPDGGPLLKALAQHHAAAKAQFNKLSEAKDLSGKVLEQLADLGELGDTITQDDVVQSAGRLVAEGLDPLQVASLLADMPPGGEALQAWVASHAQAAAANAQRLNVHHAISRHDMGMAALRELTGQALVPPPPEPSDADAGPAGDMGAQGNALTGSAAGGEGGLPHA